MSLPQATEEDYFRVREKMVWLEVQLEDNNIPNCTCPLCEPIYIQKSIWKNGITLEMIQHIVESDRIWKYVSFTGLHLKIYDEDFYEEIYNRCKVLVDKYANKTCIYLDKKEEVKDLP